MNQLLLWGGLAAAIVAALIFEDSREYIVETFEYIIGFEWWGDIWEFISSIFEDMGEISVIGIAFGAIGLATVYLARDYMLSPFLIHMGPVEAMFWGGVTYLGTFIAGYLVGKGFESTG